MRSNVAKALDSVKIQRYIEGESEWVSRVNSAFTCEVSNCSKGSILLLERWMINMNIKGAKIDDTHIVTLSKRPVAKHSSSIKKLAQERRVKIDRLIESRDEKIQTDKRSRTAFKSLYHSF